MLLQARLLRRSTRSTSSLSAKISR